MPRLSAEELVAHAASVRALAAHLVGDVHLGDDVAQDVAVAALERPPAAGVPVAPWLRGVARHLSFRALRTEARRRRRERLVARAETTSADDVVERTEVRHAVVAELLAMDEPYRRTLLLRFFEDLPPAEIARRDGVPAGTVRSRLKRGLDLLRARLDARHGGDRGAWVLLLAPRRDAPPGVPSHPAGASLAAAGGLLMGIKTIAAVLVVAAGGLAWLALRPDAASPSRDVGDVAPAQDAAAPTHPRAAAPGDAAADPAPAATQTPPAPEPAPDLWVVGRVVGDARHPVEGADVRLGDGDPAPSAASARAVTRRDGTFRIPARATEVYTAVLARTADGRVALAGAWLAGAGDVDTGTLVLGPAAALDVVVTSADAPAPGVRVTVHESFRVAAGTTDASGRVRFEPLPHGTFLVEAGDPERGHAFDAAVPVPGAARPLVLALTRRDVTVTVVRKGTDEPVAGETFDARFRYRSVQFAGMAEQAYDPPLAGGPTGADGTTVLRGAGRDDHLTVVPRSERSGGRATSNAVRCAPPSTTVRIEVPAPRTFRFRILEGEAAPPPEGTVLRLVPWTNSGAPIPAETAIVRNGEVVVDAERAESVSCFAQAPDASLAKLYARADGDGTGETTFRRERTIEVVLREPDGRPVRGATVVARDQGNNAIVPPVASGEDGVATIRGLYGRLADVYHVADARSPFGGTRIGSVDLEKGSGRLEHTVRPEIRVVLRVRLDGKPGLPTRFLLLGARVVAEDPVAGTLELAAAAPAAGTALPIHVKAPGWQPANVSIPVGAASPAEAVAELRRAGTFAARILMPPDGSRTVSLQRWDAAAGTWKPVVGMSFDGNLRVQPGGAVTVDTLAPGRYRLADASMNYAGAAVDVEEGGVADAGTFDLSRSGTVQGRVVGPEGMSVAGAQVVVEGEGVAPPPSGDSPFAQRLGAGGEFRVRVPGDRPVRLRALHPTLRTAANGGVVEVVEPRTGVELRLERGPVATLRAHAPFPRAGFGATTRILVFHGEPSGTPAATLFPAVEGDALRFGLPLAGRVTLWIDAAPWAPLVLRDVAFGEGDLDLGTREFPKGSSVRVRLLVPEGQAAPRVAPFVHAVEEPRYTRGTNSNGEREIVVAGLGKGRFELITSLVSDQGGSMRMRIIEVDGAETTEVVVELPLK